MGALRRNVQCYFVESECRCLDTKSIDSDLRFLSLIPGIRGDAVVELDEALCLTQHSRELAALLLKTPSYRRPLALIPDLKPRPYLGIKKTGIPYSQLVEVSQKGTGNFQLGLVFWF